MSLACERIVTMPAKIRAFDALLAALCFPVLFSGTCTTRAAPYSAQERLSVGKILVANEKLGDPNFAQSVILIVQFDKEVGSVGLIINRQTEIPVSRVFPKMKQAAKDPVYMGGPLEITGVQALLRLPEKANQAMHVTADTYVTASEELIEKSVVSRTDPSKFRLYLGYAGWAPGQLEAEIQVGAWSLISSDGGIIFDRDPESLWSRLNHSQIAVCTPSEFLEFATSIPARSRLLREIPFFERKPSDGIVNLGWKESFWFEVVGCYGVASGHVTVCQIAKDRDRRSR
jgi:putative transcriptional regulator